MFAKPDSRPLNPNTDYHEWKKLIEATRLPERRLHSARHTAATVLTILAVPTPTAMAIMGWSSVEMAARYQHVLDSIRKGGDRSGRQAALGLRGSERARWAVVGGTASLRKSTIGWRKLPLPVKLNSRGMCSGRRRDGDSESDCRGVSA